MSVIVNLVSNNEGALKKFLDSFFEKDSKLDDDVIEWISTYNKPLDAIDMMTALVDNMEKYDIQLRISMDAGLLVEVSRSNIDSLVKFMLYRFYNESSQEAV